LMGQQPEIANFLGGYAATLKRKPAAILLFTAHWETTVTTVSTGTSPALYYDYSGFPPETYQVKYDAPGSPEVAQKVVDCLDRAGLPVATDGTRGWDHGVFVPLKLMFPENDIPVVQVSVLKSQDAAAQFQVGMAVQSLRNEGILVLASGASFHNFGYFFARDPKVKAQGERHSKLFDDWLKKTVTDSSLSPQQRAEQLVAWDAHPSAREAHPQGAAEHLMPLFAAAGAGGGAPGLEVGEPESLGFVFSQFEWA